MQYSSLGNPPSRQNLSTRYNINYYEHLTKTTCLSLRTTMLSSSHDRSFQAATYLVCHAHCTKEYLKKYTRYRVPGNSHQVLHVVHTRYCYQVPGSPYFCVFISVRNLPSDKGTHVQQAAHNPFPTTWVTCMHAHVPNTITLCLAQQPHFSSFSAREPLEGARVIPPCTVRQFY